MPFEHKSSLASEALECIHDLCLSGTSAKIQIEWQAWKKVLSAALIIKLLIDLLPSQRTCMQTSYSGVNRDAKFQ